MGRWYLLVYSYSFNQLTINILLTYLLFLLTYLLRISPYAVRMWENPGKMRTRISPNTNFFTPC